DTASASIDIGKQVTILDDGPKITASGSGPALSVDESFIPTIGSQQLPTGSNTDTEAFSGVFTVTPGADGQKALGYSLHIDNATTNLTDAASNQTVTLVAVSSTEVDGVVMINNVQTKVFALTVDSTGHVTMEIDRGVVDSSPDANTDSNEGATLASGKVSLV